MAFKLNTSGDLSIENPIVMFNDIRQRKVPGLLGNQTEILNDYIERGIKETDVAMKVPTGGGKTLIALCIAEWRRRHFGERVVYLCPTIQLVNQVCAQSEEKYGIAVTPFIGSKLKFSANAKSEYNSAGVVAVTTYSALFNVNPFFNDPQTIVLDDAHSAEGYIASQWSVRIEKRDETLPAFNAVVALIKAHIPETDLLRLQAPWSENDHPQWIEKLPTPALYAVRTALTSSLDETLVGLNANYSWNTIRDHILGCQLYYSSREILIRPYLAPTSTHQPFAGATQRIFLSATLGMDGDLERITGRRSIVRLKEATGSERQGLGRRFFFFPGSSLDENSVNQLTVDLIREAGRSVILTTDGGAAKRYEELVQKNVPGVELFDIEAIEQSKDRFVEAPSAVAVIANRYDGIDFPDDECRLLFVSGRPSATSLHERFIVGRFGAIRALSDRIQTRIVQAFGRCTRSPTDYAVVVVVGGDLVGHLEKRENRLELHPELQAELAFGLEQSRESTMEDFLDNLKLVIAQDPVIRGVNKAILTKRDAATQAVPAGSDELKASARYEIEYAEAIWQGNYLGALAKARSALGHLQDPSLRGYRALWHYLAGSAAWLAQASNLGSDIGTAAEQYRHAVKAAVGIRWLNNLAALGPKPAVVENTPDTKAMALVENLEARIETLELIHDRKFDFEENRIRVAIAADKAADFEQGLLLLGNHLGYECMRPPGDSAPDCWWKADDQLGFVIEAHSAGEETGLLGSVKARQAKLHPVWVEANVSMSKDAEIITVLITTKNDVQPDAKPFLKGVAYWSITDFKKWVEAALSAVREARAGFAAGDLVWRAHAADILSKAGVAPVQMKEKLTGLTLK
jgi:hypothetical protein